MKTINLNSKKIDDFEKELETESSLTGNFNLHEEDEFGFSDRIFIKKRWKNCTISNGDFTCSIFQNCEFEKVVFENCYLEFVAFENCEFAECKFKDTASDGVSFKDCVLKYLFIVNEKDFRPISSNDLEKKFEQQRAKGEKNEKITRRKKAKKWDFFNRL